MTHNTREVEEDWKTELRKEYRKQTLAMAREVSASGTYEKVEGMICDWWFAKIDHQLQKAREEERGRIKQILCGLDFKKQITHLFRGDLPEQEWGSDIVQGQISDLINHSELDQDKK